MRLYRYETKIIWVMVFLFVLPANTSHASQIFVKPTYSIYKNSTLVPNEKHGNKKVILLTIDDGPTIRSKEMIDILKKHGVGAIFFINGSHDKDMPEMIKEEYKQGFMIGNHTWSHLNLKKEKNFSKIKEEVNKNTKLIKDKTGESAKFFRPPYGEFNKEIKDFIKSEGMTMMNWSGAAKDWEKNTENEEVFIGNVMNNIHNGEILLIHEHLWTVKYLDKLLTTIKEKGYTFIDPNQITTN